MSNQTHKNLSYQNLNKIPNYIFEFKNLQRFDIDNNAIKKIPETIGELKNLQSFYIDNNAIKKLPSAFGTSFSASR